MILKMMMTMTCDDCDEEVGRVESRCEHEKGDEDYYSLYLYYTKLLLLCAIMQSIAISHCAFGNAIK